ncbi:MAG: hypothetical protein RL329_611 [Bacteroidota bacterium]|jgi:hypothetical protein
MKSPSKTVLIQQLRNKYPISVEICNKILKECKLDIDCAESKIKSELATQLSQKKGISLVQASLLLQDYNFDVHKAAESLLVQNESITAKILMGKSNAEDKIGRIFTVLEESSKLGRQFSSLELDVYYFCECFYYCENESVNQLTYKKLTKLAARLKMESLNQLLALSKKEAANDDFLVEKFDNIRNAIYDYLIKFIQINIASFS